MSTEMTDFYTYLKSEKVLFEPKQIRSKKNLKKKNQ
jgi:hypothetical protein